MNGKNMIRALGYLWAAPATLIGVLIALVYNRPRSWHWSDGCLEIECARLPGGRDVAAQTHGWCVAFRVGRRTDLPLRVHEREHVSQFLIFGLLFYPVYGIDFAYQLVVTGGDFWKAYRRVWFERVAYKLQAEFEKGERPDAWGARVEI